MKTNRKRAIPSSIVYLALYAAIFAISIWLLVFHKESPTNWVLYIAMIGSVSAGLLKVVTQTGKRAPQSE